MWDLITLNEWFKHFSELLNKNFFPTVITAVQNVSNITYDLNLPLNVVITAEEINTVISQMRSGNAPVPDGIVIEMFKNSKGVTIPLLTGLNQYFTLYIKGQYT